MACNLYNIGVGADSCKESYAGTGTNAYLFFSEDVDTATLEVDEENPCYKAFALKSGAKIYKLRAKKQKNKVVGTGLGDNKGFSNVGTLVFDKDQDKLAVVERTVQNKPCGLLLERPGVGEGAYILWNPTVDTKFEFSCDTGDSYDSDSGATWTVTSAPMPYERMYIPASVFEALTVADDGAATKPDSQG